MAVTLNPVEIRVLGVLIEKSMTLPQYYPMTLNAITLACNQKNNRDPVLSLSEGDVGSALHELQRWQLVSQGRAEPGSRANKFRHEVEKKFGWTPAQRAVMCELMIRGPQTLGELRNNAARMKALESPEAVRETITELEHGEQAMAREMPRQAGQRETRFTQLLCPVIESIDNSAPPFVATESVQSLPSNDGVGGRVEELEKRMASLEHELSSIRDRLNAAGLA